MDQQVVRKGRELQITVCTAVRSLRLVHVGMRSSLLLETLSTLSLNDVCIA